MSDRGDRTVPFNRPTMVGTEFEYIRKAFKSSHVSGDGEFSKKCHFFFKKTLGVGQAFLTTSCTHALEMAAILVDVQPGDEVIVPSFTFVSTANAFALRGARIVFADIRPDTLNLDERLLSDLFSSRTKAVVPVHYAGVGCEMEPILAACNRRGIAVIEDNAHGLFGKYRGKYLGTFGCLATQSFHETKNIQCGEGGALLINDIALIERAEIIREKGTNRARFFRGQVDKYTWVDIGSSWLPSDLLAAFLWAQLEQAAEIQDRRRHAWERYDAALCAWAEKNCIRRPFVPSYCQQAFHMYYLLLPELRARTAFIQHLKARHINAVFHYVPLHTSPKGRQFGFRPGQCKVTEDVSERLVRLPFYGAITVEEQDRVADACSSFTP